MNRLVRWFVTAVALMVSAGLYAAPRDGIDVRLSAASPVVRGDVDVVVTLTVTNTNRHPVNLLRWQFPGGDLDGQLFSITRDNARVAYTGPRVKRAAPGAGDYLKLDPGTSVSVDVELTAAYDLSRNGRYDIRYDSRGGHGANASALQSETLYVWLEGRSAKTAASPVPATPSINAPAAGAPLAPALSFTGNCSASQKTLLQAAVSNATTYAAGAASYLAVSGNYGSSRYRKWFDASLSQGTAGWGTAKNHFDAIYAAFANQSLTLDCKCKQSKVYAFVYPNQPYTINLCGAFWTAPATGTDSKAGTLIHEMSHFNVVAATDDWAYGQTAAGSLAITDPVKALDNADSHEYFAENMPALQ